MSKVFVCEICTTPLGKVNLDDLAVPMTPEMFHSIDPGRGIPDPFPPILDFNLLRCRQCKRRPFIEWDRITILDEKGFHKQININKINIERKTREANQAKINEVWIEEAGEVTESAFSRVYKYVKGEVNHKFVCDTCGKGYAHQSSLARHKKVCK